MLGRVRKTRLKRTGPMARRQFPSSTMICSLRRHFSPKTFGKASSADNHQGKDLTTLPTWTTAFATSPPLANALKVPTDCPFLRWRPSRPLLASACAPLPGPPSLSLAPSAPPPSAPTAPPPRPTPVPSPASPRVPTFPTLESTFPRAARTRTSSSPTSWSVPWVPSVPLVPRALFKVGDVWFFISAGDTLPLACN